MKHESCYRICGVTLQSQLELPGIPEVTANAQRDVRICVGAVPDKLDSSTVSTVTYDVKPGQLLLRSPAARFLIRDGNEIIVQPQAAESEVRVFLLGSALGALLHQRGRLPLHGSCVQTSDGCVAFCGDSGAGKSTLAAYLAARGHHVISDDISAIEVLPDKGAVAFPGVPRIRLWQDALQSLNLDHTRLTQPRPQLDKYELPNATQADHSSVPLKRIYLLRESPDNTSITIEPVTAMAERLRELLANTYRYRFLNGLNRLPDHLRHSTEILKHVSIFKLCRPRCLTAMNDTMAKLEEHWQHQTGSETEGVPDRFEPAA